MKKSILIILVSLIVVVFGISLYISSNAKSTIEAIASDVLKTDVKISGLNVSFISKTISVNGLTIKNPSGFTDRNLLSLGHVRVSADSLFSNPIVIDEILAKDLDITAEMGKNGTNIQALQRNLKKSSQEDRESSSQETPTKSSNKKLVIHNLTIENASIQPALAVGNQSASVKVTIPTIHIKNLGAEDAAIEASEAVIRVMNKILAAASSAITSSFFQDKQNMIKETVNEMNNKLKGLFGN